MLQQKTEGRGTEKEGRRRKMTRMSEKEEEDGQEEILKKGMSRNMTKRGRGKRSCRRCNASRQTSLNALTTAATWAIVH